MKGKILVVDDEEPVRQVLKRFLTGKGYAVQTAANGKEAIETVRRDKPHLILLDMRMPGIDGMEVLKEVRKLDENIAVMMVTANEDADLARQTMILGASDYITKPFDLQYLETTVMAKLAFVGS